MALSGSLSFLTASTNGANGVNLDFIGLNSIVVDPISASANTLGFDGQDGNYLNDHVASQNSSNQLNSLLLSRNGPYQHPSWKQVRGGEHPIARKLRLNNTMSIDINMPDALVRERYKAHLRDKMISDYSQGSYLVRQNELHKQQNDHISFLGTEGILSSTFYAFRNRQFYEPPVTNKHKPFVYSVTTPEGQNLKIRSSLMNQMTFFENQELNEKLNIAGPTKATSSMKLNQKAYKSLLFAKESGAKNFVYSQTLFPKNLNAFRTYKLEKSAYEEVQGFGPNGFDRAENRSFWRSNQGEQSRGVKQDGTTRCRTIGGDFDTAGTLNSQDIEQSMGMDTARRATTRTTAAQQRRVFLFATGSGMHEIRPTGSSEGVDFNPRAGAVGWNHEYWYLAPGIIVASGSDNTCPTAPFYTLESYSPHPIALSSMWPLDPRPDVYNKPAYLTSSIGGKGTQIGLTPHRMSEYDISVPYDGTNANPSGNAVFSTSDPGRHVLLGVTYGYSEHNQNGFQGDGIQQFSSSSFLQIQRILTGTAGELVYSTKPTIFFHPTASLGTAGQGLLIAGAMKGYHASTASMQYNRHTFPYNTPFYATNKIRGRNPFYNSYSDFAQNIETIARDYSIIPEYRVSDNIDYYLKNYFKQKKTLPLYSEETISSVKNFYGEQVFENAKIIKRKVILTKGSKIEPQKTKVNFLKLDGAFLTASSLIESHTGSSPSIDNFGFDTTNIKAKATTLKQPDIVYSQDSEAVVFNESFSHTEPASDASNLIDAPFDGGLNTVPSKIRITAHAVKKLLPYKEFYPVTKTVDIGSKFKKFIYDNIDVEKSLAGMSASFNRQNNDAAGQAPDALKPAMLQSLLEPLFAPGILYNSIKSGLAVDYPIYKTDRPIYFAPSIYYSGSIHHTGAVVTVGETHFVPDLELNRSTRALVISHSTAVAAGQSPVPPFTQYGPAFTNHNFHGYASSSFNYGGFQMMGASRCIPAILNNAPSHRMPFEALYKPHFLKHFVGETNALYLTTDFLDLDLNWPSEEEASGSWNPHRLNDFVGQGHPGAAHTRTGPRAVLKKQQERVADKELYESSINNFLCETMNFFLKDQEFEGVKTPIITSQKKTNYFVDVTASLYMELSINMGKDQVMCEGPRNAGIGGGSLVSNKFSNATSRNSMRGYLYGPPIEVVRMSGSTTIEGKDIVQTDGTLVRQEPFIASPYGITPRGTLRKPEEIESYFGANLQDPAYQAFTPSYFYGPSSIIFATERHTTALTKFDEIFIQSRTDSSYSHEYVTSSIIDGTLDDMTGLCKLIPGESSVSGYYGTRMTLESSMDTFKKVTIKDDRGTTVENPIWYMMPKWVCPVLDFSSSYAYVEQTFVDNNTGEVKTTPSLVNNTYHDNTTGRGLWGGYGTDPYDPAAYEIIPNSENKEKGLFLTLKTPFTEQTNNIVQAVNRNNFNVAEGRANVRRYSDTANSQTTTGSLATELGFLNTDQEQREYKIGEIASSKLISEAIVVIPYLEKPINLVGNKGIGKGKAALPHGELYATREVIPGKHFLPIHKMLFENILSMKLAMDKYPVQTLLPGTANPKPEYVGFESGASIAAAQQTDVFKMIDALHGVELSDDSGYELPPEFDFINYNVDPFQMFVIPIEHTLNKQELIDIYQGIMPDSSMKFEKVSQTVEIQPTLIPGLTFDYSWMPRVQVTPNNFVSLGSTLAHNFMNPGFLFNNELLSLVTEQNKAALWLKNSRDFYKNIKFMTFKIKKRSTKDYDNYKARQVKKVIEEKVLSDVLPKDRDKVSIIDLDTRRTVSDVFGYNWPYDDFSLIEAAKIDIEFEVET